MYIVKKQQRITLIVLLIHNEMHELSVDKSNTRAIMTSKKETRKEHTFRIFNLFHFRKLHKHFLKVCRLF